MHIILSGSISIDRIMNFDGKFAEVIKPEKLHVLSLSVLLKDLVTTKGGLAPNIAYTLVQLGNKPTIMGSAGEDAREYMRTLSEMGIDTKFVHFSSLATATFTVMTDKDGCQVGGFYPGAMADEGVADLSEVVAAVPEKPLVVISAHDPELMARQVEVCRREKYRLFYDASQQINTLPAGDLLKGIQVAELLIVNDYELEVLQQKTTLSLIDLRKMVSVIVVTLGEQGCLIYDSRELNTQKPEIKVAAVKECVVVDPTGAGDAFRGGFLHGYVRNWPLEESAKLGSVTASFAIEKRGTQEHTLLRQKVEQRLEDTYGNAKYFINS